MRATDDVRPAVADDLEDGSLHPVYPPGEHDPSKLFEQLIDAELYRASLEIVDAALNSEQRTPGLIDRATMMQIEISANMERIARRVMARFYRATTELLRLDTTSYSLQTATLEDQWSPHSHAFALARNPHLYLHEVVSGGRPTLADLKDFLEAGRPVADMSAGSCELVALVESEAFLNEVYDALIEGFKKELSLPEDSTPQEVERAATECISDAFAPVIIR